VLLLLFGADKAPQLARSLGQARAKLDRARDQFTDAMKTVEEKAWDSQLDFERERERKVSEVANDAKGAKGAKDDDADHAKLVRAAEELGLQTQGLSDAEIREAIRARLGDP